VQTITHFLKWSVGLASAQSSTTKEERDCLARHASGKKVLVELGVWHGVTTAQLRQAMAPEGVLYAVDPYFPGQLGFSVPRVIAHREVDRAAGGKVEWVRKTSTEAAHGFPSFEPRPIDFLFIDAGHKYDEVKADWDNWSGLIAAGGIVGLHDSRSSPKRNLDGVGSMIFTQEVVLQDSRFHCFDAVDSLTMLIRK
jgi:predicted O-methyltransferase YrrM